MADVPTFRIVFPEFENTVSDDQIAFWFGQAPFAQPNPIAGYGFPLGAFGNVYAFQARLGVSLDLAVMLFAAHNITLGMADARAAERGKTPGAVVAPLTSKAAGGLSASYDTNIASNAGAGIYNATSYGQRLWKLLEQAAMGGTYAAAPPRRHVFGYGYRGLR